MELIKSVRQSVDFDHKILLSRRIGQISMLLVVVLCLVDSCLLEIGLSRSSVFYTILNYMTLICGFVILGAYIWFRLLVHRQRTLQKKLKTACRRRLFIKKTKKIFLTIIQDISDCFDLHKKNQAEKLASIQLTNGLVREKLQVQSECIAHQQKEIEDNKKDIESKVLTIKKQHEMIQSKEQVLKDSELQLQFHQGKISELESLNNTLSEDNRAIHYRIEENERELQDIRSELLTYKEEAEKPIHETGQSQRTLLDLFYSSVTSQDIEKILEHLKTVQKEHRDDRQNYAEELVQYYLAMVHLHLIENCLSPYAKYFFPDSNRETEGSYVKTFNNAKNKILEEPESCIELKEKEKILLKILGR